MTLAMTEMNIWGVHGGAITETAPSISSFLQLRRRSGSPQARVPMNLPRSEALRLERK